MVGTTTEEGMSIMDRSVKSPRWGLGQGSHEEALSKKSCLRSVCTSCRSLRGGSRRRERWELKEKPAWAALGVLKELERSGENQKQSQEYWALFSVGKQEHLQLSSKASVGGSPPWQTAPSSGRQSPGSAQKSALHFNTQHH